MPARATRPAPPVLWLLLLTSPTLANAQDGPFSQPGARDAAPPPPLAPPGLRGGPASATPIVPPTALPPALPGNTPLWNNDTIGLPSVRALVAPPMLPGATGPMVIAPTPIYPTSMMGAIAWLGPAPDYPPLLPTLVPDVAKRCKYHVRNLLGMGPSAGPGVGPVYGAAPDVEFAPAFTWRDWLTQRDEPGRTRR